MTLYAVQIGLGAVSVAECPWHGQGVQSLLVNSVDLNAACSKCGRIGVVEHVITNKEHWALIRQTEKPWTLESKGQPLG